MRKAAALDAHLERAMTPGRFWGAQDCFLWPSDWVVTSGHDDPAFPWRGRYSTALGAARIVWRAGGIEALWSARAEVVGLRATDHPIAGDVGLVTRETADVGAALRDRVGAICLGGGDWALATPQGLRFGRWPIIRAWRVPWRR